MPSIFSICVDQVTRPSFLVDFERAAREKQHIKNREAVLNFLKTSKKPAAVESIAEATEVTVREIRHILRELQTEGLATLKGKRGCRQKLWAAAPGAIH